MLTTTSVRSSVVADIVERTDFVLGNHKRPISLHEPTLGDLERESVLACLDSGWVSSVGPFVGEFEQTVAAHSGAKYGVAVVNGTAALHAALLLSGVQRDDEVIVPALTFVATANAVGYLGAYPHFVDASPTTLGMDPHALRSHLADVAVRREGMTINRQTGRVIRAVVPVHVFGHLVDMPALNEVASEFGLAVIEDATESLGSYFAGSAPRLSAKIAVLSFNGNKIVTTGGGGMILTDDANLARDAKHLTTTAKKPHAWAFEHDRIGFNYRMPNINAALGLAQMRRFEGFVSDKRALADRYRAAFMGAEGFAFFQGPAHSVSNYWLNAIVLDPDYSSLRDEVLERLGARGIMARPIWTPLNRLPMYRAAPTAPLPVTEDLAARTINLPSSPFLAQSAKS